MRSHLVAGALGLALMLLPAPAHAVPGCAAGWLPVPNGGFYEVCALHYQANDWGTLKQSENVPLRTALFQAVTQGRDVVGVSVGGGVEQRFFESSWGSSTTAITTTSARAVALAAGSAQGRAFAAGAVVDAGQYHFAQTGPGTQHVLVVTHAGGGASFLLPVGAGSANVLYQQWQVPGGPCREGITASVRVAGASQQVPLVPEQDCLAGLPVVPAFPHL